jgi:hypothetical protein
VASSRAGGQVLVAAGPGPPGQQGGPPEQVAVAPRRPQVADPVAAEPDGHPGRAQPGQRQRRPVAGGDGGQRDALGGEPLDQPLQPRLGHLGQGEGVADGHPAGQAEGAGPLDDQVDGERPQLAAVVQVDVQAAAVPAGDAEDGVQVLDRPTVEARRVEAADQVGAGPDGRLQQLGGAGR